MGINSKIIASKSIICIIQTQLNGSKIIFAFLCKINQHLSVYLSLPGQYTQAVHNLHNIAIGKVTRVMFCSQLLSAFLMELRVIRMTNLNMNYERIKNYYIAKISAGVKMFTVVLSCVVCRIIISQSEC